MKTAYINKEAWIVTMAHKVYNISLDPSTGYAMTQWNYTEETGGGARTYITPYGLFFGKISGFLYRVDKTTPTSTALKPIWKASSPGKTNRSCITSFQANGKPYLGVAWWNSAGNRVFTRFPLRADLPDKIDVAQAVEVEYKDGAGIWGYSCFTDQARGYFWSTNGGAILGVDLNKDTLDALSVADSAPNGSFSNATLGNLFSTPKNGRKAYAITGDGSGNILNGSAYTYAFEPISNTVFVSGNAANTLKVVPADCFSKAVDCTHNVTEVSTASLAGIGPLSALGDGTVLGLTRGTGQAYLISLTDPTDPSKGLNFTRIADLKEDPYMYTDFTGATLYAKTQDQIVDFTQFPGYLSGKSISTPTLKWSAESNLPENWVGLKLEARCYSAANPNLPPLEEITPVPKAEESFSVSASTCQEGKVFDTMEIKISQPQSTSSVFSHVSKIQVGFQQVMR